MPSSSHSSVHPFSQRVDVTADFAANTIDSSAASFYHEADGAYTGTVSGAAIVGQRPSGGASQLSESLDGTLIIDGANYASSIGMEGDIVASGTDPIGGVAGVADGLVGTEFFTGVFSVEK